MAILFQFNGSIYKLLSHLCVRLNAYCPFCFCNMLIKLFWPILKLGLEGMEVKSFMFQLIYF